MAAASRHLISSLANVKHNAVANLIGRLSGAAVTLLAIPIVVRLVGIESYGIVGFFASLQAIFGLLDLGLSMTMTREMARGGHDPEQAQRTRDLIRTLEAIYWAIGALIAIIAVAIAPLLATHWLHAEKLSATALRQSIAIMGIVIACQWPISLYEGGITGLQRQVIVNVVSFSATIVRTIGAVAVLFFVSRTIQAYLLTQGIAYGVQTLILRQILWNSVPSAGRAQFSGSLIRELWRFAGGINVTSALGLVLTQADKVILSKIVPLSVFGYYAIASTAANGLYYIIGPLFTAIYPQLAQNVVSGAEERLTSIYHRGCQVIAACVFPTAIVLALFSHRVLLLWTHDPQVAAGAALATSLLAVGTMLHAAMHLPYGLQLAYGWTSLTMTANAIFAAAMPLLMIVLARKYGISGAAAVWIFVNFLYVAAVIPMMHRRVLRGEMASWYRDDLVLPVVAAFAGAILWRVATPAEMSPLAGFAAIVAAAVTSLSLTALATRTTRQWLLDVVARRRSALLEP